MHSLLEQYLSEVGAQLTALPAKKRREELCEIQTHLENAADANRQLGQSEEEATRNATAQFGTPEELGRSTVTAWRRGVTRDWRDLGSAAAITFLMLLLEHLLMTRFGALHVAGITVRNALPSAGLGCVAAFCGLSFPRRAVLGVGIGVALYYIFFHALFDLPYAYASGDAIGGPLGTWIMVRLTAWTMRKRLARA